MANNILNELSLEQIEEKVNLDTANNYAKIFPKGYYIEIDKLNGVSVFDREGYEIYNKSHNLDKLLEKKNGETIYQVINKSSVDLMIDGYGKHQIEKIANVPKIVISNHTTTQINEKIIEVPKEVIKEIEVPYEVKVEVTQEVDTLSCNILKKASIMPEVEIPLNCSANQVTKKIIRNATNILLKKAKEYKYNRLFLADIYAIGNVEFLNTSYTEIPFFGVYCENNYEVQVIDAETAVFKMDKNIKIPTFYDNPSNNVISLVFVSIQLNGDRGYLKLHDLVKLSLENQHDYLIM
ncbi:hypothetical protein [Enterococcus italicus]|uniref:hypothetical protein n=1 Tax=Enterococcus italicus TaxID=246144 RepID=UPI0028A99B4D|nr:hypothetical protein [Enterococcus italicus]